MKKVLFGFAIVLTSVSFHAQANIAGLDCRPSEQYWESNEGFRVDLTSNTYTSYKDNGHTSMKSGKISCQVSASTIECQADAFNFSLPDTNYRVSQDSSDASDILGSAFGSGSKRALVTFGSLTVHKIFRDKVSSVSCIVRD